MENKNGDKIEKQPGTLSGKLLRQKFLKARSGGKKKLVLIEPKSPGIHIYSKIKLPRLGAVLLGTIMKQLGWDVSVYVEDIGPIDYKDVLSADVVGISTITSTATRAYAMSDALRDYGVPVVMGGPHVTFLQEDALAHCDFVMRGECEKAFPIFLDTFIRGGDMSAVPNLSYYDEDGKLIDTPKSEPVDDLDSLPYPDYTVIKGWMKAKGFGNYDAIIPVQATRGCPYGCNFCSVIGMFGRKMRWRSADNIVTEIEQYKDKNNYFFFYDDNFTASRTKAKDILKLSQSRGLDFKWSAQVRVDLAKDDELLALMRKTKCSNVYIGFETVNPESLKLMKKQQTVEDMNFAIRKLKENHIDVHGMFVFGFDTDNLETLQETVKFARKSGISSAQFLILVPLPGTPLFDQLVAENRLTISEWALYDTHHVVFEPKNISPFDLQLMQLKAHASFYSWPRTVKRLVSVDVPNTLLYLYARHMNFTWRKSNKIYMQALELVEKARDMNLSFDIHSEIDDIKAQLQAAVSGTSAAVYA